MSSAATDTQSAPFSRRSLLAAAGLGVTGSLAHSVVGSTLWPAEAAPKTGQPAFVDAYRTNTVDNLSAESNAVIRILNGMAEVWQTGDRWDTGQPLRTDVTTKNLLACRRNTGRRTPAGARDAFIYDRQHQSYAATEGLEEFTDAFRATTLAVTSVTEAPDGTPATRISDEIPADAPPGSELGAGSEESPLGAVVGLVNTVRGPYASSNPAKYTFQYPRPWRMNLRNEVVDTGRIDAFGFPVYASPVDPVDTLLRQRGEQPSEDGGYPSGHTNAFWLAAIALAYAFPEKFQQLIARASDLAHGRIVSGMHSPLDVIGGRVMATALAAATLHDPEHAGLKATARTQAADWLSAQLAGGPLLPAVPDPEVVARVRHQAVYELTRRGPNRRVEVPKGAEVLLETRFPYLTSEQRRDVLRSTALPSGYPILDGPEEWGRIDLFTAAGGPCELTDSMIILLRAESTGLAAADRWSNDISGPGSLVVQGSGRLELVGDNAFTGGITVDGGTLVAGSSSPLGRGTVTVNDATLELRGRTSAERVELNNATMIIDRSDTDAALLADKLIVGPGSVLKIIDATGERQLRPTDVIRARIHGAFDRVIHSPAS